MLNYTVKLKSLQPVNNETVRCMVVKLDEDTNEFYPVYGWIKTNVNSDVNNIITISLSEANKVTELETKHGVSILPRGTRLRIEFVKSGRQFYIDDIINASPELNQKIINDENVGASEINITKFRYGDNGEITANFIPNSTGDLEVLEISNKTVQDEVVQRIFTSVSPSMTKVDLNFDKIPNIIDNMIVARWRNEISPIMSKMLAGKYNAASTTIEITNHIIESDRIKIFVRNTDTDGPVFSNSLVLNIKNGNKDFIVTGAVNVVDNRTIVHIAGDELERVLACTGDINVIAKIFGDNIDSNTYTINIDNVKPITDVVVLNPMLCSLGDGTMHLTFDNTSSSLEKLTIDRIKIPGSNLIVRYRYTDIPNGELAKNRFSVELTDVGGATKEVLGNARIFFTYAESGKLDVKSVGQLTAELPPIAPTVEYNDNGELVIHPNHNIPEADSLGFEYKNITLYSGNNAIFRSVDNVVDNDNDVVVRDITADSGPLDKLMFKYTYAGRPYSPVMELSLTKAYYDLIERKKGLIKAERPPVHGNTLAVEKATPYIPTPTGVYINKKTFPRNRTEKITPRQVKKSTNEYTFADSVVSRGSNVDDFESTIVFEYGKVSIDLSNKIRVEREADIIDYDLEANVKKFVPELGITTRDTKYVLGLGIGGTSDLSRITFRNVAGVSTRRYVPDRIEVTMRIPDVEDFDNKQNADPITYSELSGVVNIVRVDNDNLYINLDDFKNVLSAGDQAKYDVFMEWAKSRSTFRNNIFHNIANAEIGIKAKFIKDDSTITITPTDNALGVADSNKSANYGELKEKNQASKKKFRVVYLNKMMYDALDGKYSHISNLNLGFEDKEFTAQELYDYAKENVTSINTSSVGIIGVRALNQKQYDKLKECINGHNELEILGNIRNLACDPDEDIANMCTIALTSVKISSYFGNTQVTLEERYGYLYSVDLDDPNPTTLLVHTREPMYGQKYMNSFYKTSVFIINPYIKANVAQKFLSKVALIDTSSDIFIPHPMLFEYHEPSSFVISEDQLNEYRESLISALDGDVELVNCFCPENIYHAALTPVFSTIGGYYPNNYKTYLENHPDITKITLKSGPGAYKGAIKYKNIDMCNDAVYLYQLKMVVEKVGGVSKEYELPSLSVSYNNTTLEYTSQVHELSGILRQFYYLYRGTWPMLSSRPYLMSPWYVLTPNELGLGCDGLFNNIVKVVDSDQVNNFYSKFLTKFWETYDKPTYGIDYNRFILKRADEFGIDISKYMLLNDLVPYDNSAALSCILFLIQELDAGRLNMSFEELAIRIRINQMTRNFYFIFDEEALNTRLGIINTNLDTLMIQLKTSWHNMYLNKQSDLYHKGTTYPFKYLLHTYRCMYPDDINDMNNDMYVAKKVLQALRKNNSAILIREVSFGPDLI